MTDTPARKHVRPGVSRIVSTDDVDLLAGSISGWSQTYEQLSAGLFRGSLTEVCLGATQLFLEQTSLALRQTCAVPAGHVWFGLPLAPALNVRINGMTADEDRIVLHRGGQPFELVTPENLNFWGIVVSEDKLMQLASQYGCHATWLEKMLDQPFLKIAPALIREAQSACDIMLQAQGQLNLSPESALAAGLTEHLLDTLFMLFRSASSPDRERLTARQRRRLVAHVDGYVRAHRDRLVTITELCAQLSISRRALQASFQEVVGLSPHAYIRAVSLNAVRKELKDTDASRSSIQDIATAFGFWHMSQFARDYRRLFGEKPSDTLKRRNNQAARCPRI